MLPNNPDNDISQSIYVPKPEQIVDEQPSGKLVKTKPAAKSEETSN